MVITLTTKKYFYCTVCEKRACASCFRYKPGNRKILAKRYEMEWTFELRGQLVRTISGMRPTGEASALQAL